MLLLLIISSGCSGVEIRDTVSHSVNPDLSIKKLSERAGASEGDALLAEDAYIIVHPSYYLFFQKKPFETEHREDRNVVESFLARKFSRSDSLIHFMGLMKEYERNEKNFLSLAREKGKLLILILPGNYLHSDGYIYRNKSDEYARYLNDVTRGSGTVFYLESVSINRGDISDEDLGLLVKSLRRYGVVDIFIGGGYIGRCQKEFYTALTRAWPDNSIALVPEISAFSPDDISESTAELLLTPGNKFNAWAADYVIKNSLMKDHAVSTRNLPELLPKGSR